jgi:Domain of unknown function (DUF1905)/Bacteriocin-protection, YdeI or OmpD-Associated
MKKSGKQSAKLFEATLERLRSNLGWTIVFVPFDVKKLWGSEAKLRVKGEINGFAFRTSLFSTGKGRHFLLVNKRMQAGAHVLVGDAAEFRLEPDLGERVPDVPSELRRLLAEDHALEKWFGKLSYSIRKWLCDQITNVKSAAARSRRAEQIAEQLLSALEAELELPPLLKLAFSREPHALEGWNLMSPIQRRGQLLAIFYYRSPEARDRRIEKVVQMAVEFAERKRAKV